MNMRQALIAALRGDPELIQKLAGPLRGRVDQDDGALTTVVHAAEALEPILAEAVERRPSRLNRLGFRSAHLLAGLAASDTTSNQRLARIAKGKTVGIVFVDVAGFTRFTAENGDDAARELVWSVASIVRDAIVPVKGELVKHLGDGFLLAFPSASQAVRGATRLRRAFRRWADGRDLNAINLRIAIHAGEPLVEQDDLLGHDVNLTARLLDHCEPGEIIASGAAKELAERRLRSAAFVDPTLVKIRGLALKVPVYQVRPAR